MQIRPYTSDDLSSVYKLFVDTIHIINLKDYNTSQIKAWSNININELNKKMLSTNSKVITENNNILGFANIDDTGYIDMFYIHADYQGVGLGSLLLNSLENDVDVKLFSVHASITARPFFEQRGYQVKHQNRVHVRGRKFINYTMTKLAKHKT